MVACVDEFKDRSRVGPVRGVPAESLDCGFITPRGCRMFKSGPVSRMAARHEAPARDILETHADSFMAVCGYRKTHARSSAQGRVTNVMRESGVRGVRRGGTPVAARPARGTGGGPDLVERGFEAESPNRPHVADVAYVRMANDLFDHMAFAADVFARRIVGRACATAMDTGGLPLRALEQAVSWGRPAWRRGRSRAPFRPGRAVHPSCTPPGSGNSACLPRPARSATRTATPWPGAPTARTGPSSSGGASPSGI